jgi:hypothetical protein
MPKRLDLTGYVYSRLKVVRCVGARNKRVHWECLCDCGNIAVVSTGSLRSGNCSSCGCYNIEQVKKAGKSRSTHGMKRTPEYRCWAQLKHRCINKDSQGYADYGGRGITVCDEWKDSFETFFKDMGPRPSPKYSLDRIDNDGPYCKENCKWSTRKEQANNKRSCRILVLGNEAKTVAEWSEVVGLKGQTIRSRLSRGWSVKDALTTPAKENGRVR